MTKTLLTFIGFFLLLSSYAQHVIVKKNNDKLTCVVMELKYDTLTYIINNQLKKIHMKEVSTIFFSEYVAYDGSLLVNEEEKYAKDGKYIIKYRLKDRTMTQIPRISCGTEDKGTVVVTIIVDRYGNVLSAEPGAIGSTTSNAYLYAKAQFAALETKFNQSPTGPIKTTGTITITY